METKNIKKSLIYSFFLFYFLIGCFTYDDYGVNIEEHTQLFSGIYWLNYTFEFLSIDLFKDDLLQYLKKFDDDASYLPNPSFYTYGPIFDVPTALIDVILNTQKNAINFEYRHFLVFSIFYLTSILVFKILIRRFNNFFVSFFGTLLYVFSPRIYGDSFHNNKDIIFLSFVIFSIFFAFKIFEKKKNKEYIIIFSICSYCNFNTYNGIIFTNIVNFFFIFKQS